MANPAAIRHWQAAQQSLAARDMAAARRHLQATLDKDSGNTMARVLLAGVELAEGRLRAASDVLLQARRHVADAGMALRVVQALLRVGEVVAAREVLQSPQVSECRHGPTLAGLAHAWQMIGDHPAALALMDRARAVGFDNPEFGYYRAIQLQFNGRLDDAREELEACVKRGPSHGRAWLTLVRLLGKEAGDGLAAQIATQHRRVTPGSEDQAALFFAEYQLLEQQQKFAEAWQALASANAVMYRKLGDHRREEAMQLEAMLACDVDFLQPAEVEHDGPQPIFILGMPRSGTTLLDRILGNHPEVTSAGELGDFNRQLRWVADVHGRGMMDPQLENSLLRIDFAEVGRRYLAQTQWRAEGRRYFVDKLPPNFWLAGLIAKALPQAKILHLDRAPLDVCFSNWRALFGDAYPYSYHLDALAEHHGRYRRLMRHWHAAMPGRILDVGYADLVDDAEGAARKVFAHCGLDFEAGCTDLARNAAPVATLSAMQVRSAIDRRGMGASVPYAGYLKPLIASFDAEPD